MTGFGPVASIVTGRANAIAYDPKTAGTAYLGGAGGGIWKTIDFGLDWTVLSDGPAFPVLNVSSIAVNPTNGRNILVGTGDYDGGTGSGVGFMRTFDGGLTWSNIPVGGVVSAIVFDPDNPQIVTATSGAILRSTDGGSTWTVPITAPGGDWSSISIGAKDALGNRAYYASLRRDGIYKSTDRGATWVRVPLDLPLTDIANLPANKGKNLVGLKVTASILDPNTAYVVDSAVITTTPQLDDGRIFKTTDGGANWTDITGTYFDGAAYNALDQLVTTPGLNWSKSSYDLVITPDVIPFTVGGVTTNFDTLYVGGGTLSGAFGPTSNLWTDITETETRGATVSHAAEHAMAIDPTNPAKALYTNDGGVYGLTFTGTSPTKPTWDTSSNSAQFLNRTLGLTQVNAADFTPQSSSVMIVGAQNNGSPAANGNLGAWINPGADNGGGCAINPTNLNVQYASTNRLDIFGTTNLWASKSDLTALTPHDSSGNPFNGDPLPTLGRLTLSPLVPNLLFVGTNYLWFWDQNAQAWTMHAGSTQLATTANSFVLAIAAANQDSSIQSGSLGAPSHGGVVYASTTDGKLWMSINVTSTDTNNPAKWVEIDTPTVGTLYYTPVPGVPPPAVTAISVNPTNPFDILVAVTGGGLFRCADTGGAPFLTYTNQSGLPGLASLPGTTINDVTRDPGNPNNVFYAATDIGVFRTLDGGSSWQNATEPLGLPNVECETIKTPLPVIVNGVLTNNNPYLYVGTYGRGVWRIPLSTINPPTAVAASLTVKSGLARVNGVLEMSLIITNTSGATGTAATNVTIAAANVTAGGKTFGATTLPNIGTLPAGQSVTVTVAFPSTAPSSGTVATITGSVTAAGGIVAAVPTTTTRLP